MQVQANRELLISCVGLSAVMALMIGLYGSRKEPHIVAVLTVFIWLAAIGMLYVIYRRLSIKLAHKQNTIAWMIGQIPGGFLSVDSRNRVDFASEGALELIRSLTNRDQTAIGIDVSELFAQAGIQEEIRGILGMIRSGENCSKKRITVQEKALLFNAAPIIDPHTRQIAGAMMHMQDVSAAAAAANQAKEFNDSVLGDAVHLQTLLDLLPLMVLAVDKDERITIVNEAFLGYFPCCSRGSLIGTCFRSFVARQGGNFEEMALIQALQGYRTVAQEIELNGRIFLSYAYPVTENGHVIGAVGVFQEITEVEMLKHERSQMERLSLVGQMAASITHEIRNPMAVIRGFIQLIKERTSPDLQEYFAIILEELDRTNEIINDFLSLAKNRVVPMESDNMNRVIRSLYPMIVADANLRGIEVDMRLDHDVPDMLLNEKEIKQLILNLVRNGLEAMDGKGVIKLETHVADEQVEVAITDTGSGISEEKLQRIFEPFYTSKENGTGLGLPVCLSIVERHKGKMNAFSTEGKGTAFIMTFPLHT